MKSRSYSQGQSILEVNHITWSLSGVWRGEIELWKRRFQSGCMKINLHIGLKLSHSFGGVVMIRYTKGLVEGQPTI